MSRMLFCLNMLDLEEMTFIDQQIFFENPNASFSLENLKMLYLDMGAILIKSEDYATVNSTNTGELLYKIETFDMETNFGDLMIHNHEIIFQTKNHSVDINFFQIPSKKSPQPLKGLSNTVEFERLTHTDGELTTTYCQKLFESLLDSVFESI